MRTRIAVIGTGYVGLSTGVCLAELGHQVICMDSNHDKIEQLSQGELPFYEPGLFEGYNMHRKSGALQFTTEYALAAAGCEIVFITVGTPVKQNGEVDLLPLTSAMEQLAPLLKDQTIMVIKSTVPAGTAATMERLANDLSAPGVHIYVASNPEFLREGTALTDMMQPDRIVIGTATKEVASRVANVFKGITAPLLFTDRESAELIKIASNTFLALKVSFINEIANVSEKIGADISLVAQGIGMDQRIGSQYLSAGIGYGGFCLPKDTRAQLRIAENVDYDMRIVRAIIEVNQHQRVRFVDRIIETLGGSVEGKQLAIMGLTFKPNTDDLRDAPSIDIMRALLDQGAKLRAHDPIVWRKQDVINQMIGTDEQIQVFADPYEAIVDAEAMIVVTEWDTVKQLDLQRVQQLLRVPVFVDGRYVFEPSSLRSLGFTYQSMGRS